MTWCIIVKPCHLCIQRYDLLLTADRERWYLFNPSIKWQLSYTSHDLPWVKLRLISNSYEMSISSTEQPCLVGWDAPDMCRPARVIMIVADALAPNKHQSISNHHDADAIVIMASYGLYYAIRIALQPLTHWDRSTHTCVGNLTISGSDNGLSPGRRQAIIWTNAGILLIGPLGTNFREILIEIHAFSFTKMHVKQSSAKWRPFCLGLNVLNKLDGDRDEDNPSLSLLSAGSSS